jgi:hypothetical protein
MLRSAAEPAPATHASAAHASKAAARCGGARFVDTADSQQQTAEHQRQDRPGGHRVALHGKLLGGVIR